MHDHFAGWMKMMKLRSIIAVIIVVVALITVVGCNVKVLSVNEMPNRSSTDSRITSFGQSDEDVFDQTYLSVEDNSPSDESGEPSDSSDDEVEKSASAGQSASAEQSQSTSASQSDAISSGYDWTYYY